MSEAQELSVEAAMSSLGHNDGKTDKEGMAQPAPGPNRAPVEEKPDEDKDKEAKDDTDGKPADDVADDTGSDDPDASEDAGKDGAEAGEDDTDDKDTHLEEEQTEDWGSTGDENGDAVLTMLQEAKVTQAEAEAMLFEAVKTNDPSKINRDLLVEKMGEAQATLIINASKDFMAANAKKVAEVKKTVHDAAGGKENWEKVADWAGKNMSDAERGEYAEMIDQGGLKAKFAADQMIKSYEADSKNSTLSAAEDTHLGESSSPPAGRAITRAEMVQELDALHNRAGLSWAETQKKDREIRAARKLGQAQGL